MKRDDVAPIRQFVVLSAIPLALIFGIYLAIHLYEASIPPQAFMQGVLAEAFDTGRQLATHTELPTQSATVLSATEKTPMVDAPSVVSSDQAAIDTEETISPRQRSHVDSGNSFVLSSHEKEELLTLHNNIRSSVGIEPLSWSVALEASAQMWSNALKENGCTIAHSGNGFGENIYYSKRTGDILTPRTPEEVIEAFMVERSFYNHDTHTCEPGEICGHYTQIIWGQTTDVGCAKSVCRAGGREEVWTCHYAPTGNVEGKTPY